MLPFILIALAVLVVIFIAVVAARPSDFTITRKIAISALPAEVFTHVNDLHLWQEWSPWAKKDPNSVITYSGPGAGKDASFHWAGNKEVGEGRMTIAESHASNSVKIRLDFEKPFRANHLALFTFTSEGASTVVTWSMSGQNNFLFKAVGMFLNVDKMVGQDFEKGLASLKAIVETGETK